MKVRFFTNSTINQVEEQKITGLDKSDLVVFGFNGLGLVSYKKELSGETEYFCDLAKLSKQLNSVIVCGCDTDTYGVFRHSAVIADKGKILGVADMMHQINDSEYVAGGAVKVYETSAGKIGVLIAEDLFFPSLTEILSLCDADVIVCVFMRIDSLMPQVVLRAMAYINGLPMCLVAKSYALAVNAQGEVQFQSGGDNQTCQIKKEKSYRQISVKRRGLSR